MKFCVFPNDPLFRYLEKGEVKPRYWNPLDLFSEVHLISLSNEITKPESIQIVAGKAKLFIHAIGRPKISQIYAYRKKVTDLVASIKPSLIRAHNPLLMGWYAVTAGRKLNIPTVISMHADYSLTRRLQIEGFKSWKRDVFQLIFRALGEESFTFKNASKIVLSYRFLSRYASHWRNDNELIYNRVSLDQFDRPNISKEKIFTLLNVGNQIPGKNPEPIIRAIKGLPLRLIIIGQGPLHDHLKEIARHCEVSQQIEFIPSVPYSQLPDYYAKVHGFAIFIAHPGVCMPVMEAMASGLPVIINQPLFEDQPEVLEDRGLVVEATPSGYRQAFEKLLASKDLLFELGEKGKAKMKQLDGLIMEKKERDLYQSLCKNA